MPLDLVIVAGVFVIIVAGVATYKHYKKKARLAKKKLDEATGGTPVETPKAPSVGGGGSRENGHVQQEIK